MKYIKTGYFYLSLLLFFSCAQKENKNSSIELRETKTMEINIPNNVYYYSFLNQVYSENDSIYLARKREHTGDMGIDIINLSSKKYIKSIIFSEEGNNGIGRLNSFYKKGNDSMIIVNNKDILTISNNTIINRKSFIQGEEYFPILGTNNSPNFFDNEVLYFFKLKFSPPYENDFFTSNTLMYHNLENGKVGEMENTNFSSEYLDKCWSYFDADMYSTANNKKEVLFSYPIDSYIYIYSLTNRLITRKIDIKSDFDDNSKSKSVNCSKIHSYNEDKHRLQKFYYSNLIYDKYRDVYYRFTKLPIKEYKSNKKYSGSFDRDFTIIVIDKTFNIIGESKKFKKYNYLNFDWFITEEGLWISKNNPKSNSYNEDTLSYTLLNF